MRLLKLVWLNAEFSLVCINTKASIGNTYRILLQLVWLDAESLLVCINAKTSMSLLKLVWLDAEFILVCINTSTSMNKHLLAEKRVLKMSNLGQSAKAGIP